MYDLVKISRWCAKYARKKMRLGQDSWLNHRQDIQSHTYLECLKVSKKEKVKNMESHLFTSGKHAACNYIKKNIYAYNKEINLSEFFLRTLVDDRPRAEYSPEWRELYENLKKFTTLTRKQKKGVR